MNDKTPLPAAGGSYRLDGEKLTRVAAPTKSATGKVKKSKFVGGETRRGAAKPKNAPDAPPVAEPAAPQTP